MKNKLSKKQLVVAVVLGLVVGTIYISSDISKQKNFKYAFGTRERQLEEYFVSNFDIDQDKIKSIELVDRTDLGGARLTFQYKSPFPTDSKHMVIDRYFQFSKSFSEKEPPFKIVNIYVRTFVDGVSGEGLSKDVKEGEFEISFDELKSSITKIDSPENFEKFLTSRGSIFVRNYSERK